jgi:hypothetical protein
MKITYQSKNYKPEAVLKRYVRWDGDVFLFCEVGKSRRYDLRQGIIDSDELPEIIRLMAMEKRGCIPSYVEWPL